MLRLGLALCLLAPPALAQAPDEAPPDRVLPGLAGLVATPEGARLFAEGHDALIDWRLDAADAAFRELGRVEPGSAAGAYGRSKATLWEAVLREREPYPSRFYDANDSLRSVLDALPEGAWREHLEGEALMHRAILGMRREKYAAAGRSFHGACGAFKALTRDAAEPFAEAQLGRGVCLIAAGAIPSEYKWVARLFGFRGTVADGLAMVQAAIDSAVVAPPEAAMMLAIADAALNENRAGGLERLADLAEARPGSPLVAYLHGTLLLERRRAPDAEAEFRRALALTERADVASFPFAHHHLGIALFRQDRFAEAAREFETFLREHRGPALRAQATLHAGLSREMEGQRARAEAHYRRVRAARDVDSDQQAKREAERRLAAPLTPSERAVLLGASAYDGGRYARAIRVLQPVVTDGDAPTTLRAEAAYRMGRAHQALDDPDAALRFYAFAIANPGDPLAKWGPWAVYHQGEVHEEAGRLAEARAAYERALADDEPFDFHQSLEQRGLAALERIERAGG